MRSFLEQYGTAIFTLVIISILITFAGPVGTMIKRNVNTQIQNVNEIGSETIRDNTENMLTPIVKITDNVLIKDNCIQFDKGTTTGNLLSNIQFSLFNTMNKYMENFLTVTELGQQELHFTHTNSTGFYNLRFKANGTKVDAAIYYGNIYLKQNQEYVLKFELIKASRDQYITSIPILLEVK